MRNGTFHICVEGLFEAQKKQGRLVPEVLYIGVQMGAILGQSIASSTKRVWLLRSMDSSGTNHIGTM